MKKIPGFFFRKIKVKFCSFTVGFTLRRYKNPNELVGIKNKMFYFKCFNVRDFVNFEMIRQIVRSAL